MLTDLFLSHKLAIEKVGREKKMDICPPLAIVIYRQANQYGAHFDQNAYFFVVIDTTIL